MRRAGQQNIKFGRGGIFVAKGIDMLSLIAYTDIIDSNKEGGMMADITIRNIPDEIHGTLKEKAAADGKGLETWVREQLTLLAAQPTIRKSYTFKCFGDNGARVTIRRLHGGAVQHGANGCSREQFAAYEKADLLCERNEIGDYEAAYKLLLGAFSEVFTS